MAALKGGQKLLNRLKYIVGASKSRHVRIGFMENSTYPDGTSTPMVAAIHEWGAPGANIPARPYFRPMIEAKSPKWGDQLANVTKAADFDTAVALGRMGEGIKGQLQEAIRTQPGPPLSDATIAKKGFATRLIETGHMINSVDWDVKPGRGGSD